MEGLNCRHQAEITPPKMRTITTLMMTLLLSAASGQGIQDFKTKTTANQTDRTMMLDILRAKIYEEHKQEFVFVVKHFKVGGNYAWFMGDATRRDGKEVRLSEDYYDCCHVEALFKKNAGKWYIVESSAFSSDLWWQGISKRHPAAPIGIFDQFGR